jgi:succinate dehydrogenase / fumarate reductase cytochrome b subunit
MSTQKATFLSSAWTTVGKKVLTGITGIAWILFTIAHLIGNFQLFLNDGGLAFNTYTKFLESQGILLYIAEAGLVLTLLLHAAIGINIWLGKRRARPVGYVKYKSAGEPSAQNASSRSMIITGSVLLIFLVVHIWTFKFGPSIAQGYTMMIEGETARDLYRLVIETFQNPIYVFGYTFVMILLGLHLRHGFWSAFQSLGAVRPSARKSMQRIGVIVAILLAVGFLSIPLYIYFFVNI